MTLDLNGNEREKLSDQTNEKKIGEKYYAPLSVIHRGDLQSILLRAAKDLHIPIRLKSKVTSIDPPFSARLQLESGEWVTGDVVICADDIKSPIRRQMAAAHGVKDHSRSTSDAAYRVLIPKADMKNDKRALELLGRNVGMRWMGPGGYIMAYPIKNNTVYNMVLLNPAKQKSKKGEGEEEEESWTSKGDKREMMAFYSEWNDTVRDLLSYVPEGEVMEWTLNSHSPLPTWIENKCVLIGDACHPMLP